MVSHLAKVGLSAALGLFALLVAADNVLDFDTNFAFIRHVLSMDTTFPGGRLRDRAIHGEAWWRAGYMLIIVGEAVTGVLFLIGSVRLFQKLRAPGRAFEDAKAWAILGAASGFAVWFVGFMLIGGEWFQMWQSTTWNGQEAAFRIYMTMLAVLIYIGQPDREIKGAGDDAR